MLAVILTLPFHVRDGSVFWQTVLPVKASNCVFGILLRKERSWKNSLFPKEIEKQINTIEFKILVILKMLMRILCYIH